MDTIKSNGEYEMHSNPLSTSAVMGTGDGEGVNDSIRGTGASKTEAQRTKQNYEHVCSTVDMPHAVQYFLNIVMGRGYFYVPIFLIVFCFCMLGP
jgi:hypothetical protein